MKRDEDSIFQIPSLPKQRATISQNEAADVPKSAGGIPPLRVLEPNKPPQDIEDRKGEARRIVKRLLAIIEEHRVSALRMEFTLDAPALDTVIRALEAETRNEDAALVLNDVDEIRRYILTSLYEDLLAEPSNILFTTHIAKDVVRYEAMEADFWEECLALLRTQLLPDSP
jgi:hypothetical protein